MQCIYKLFKLTWKSHVSSDATRTGGAKWRDPGSRGRSPPYLIGYALLSGRVYVSATSIVLRWLTTVACCAMFCCFLLFFEDRGIWGIFGILSLSTCTLSITSTCEAVFTAIRNYLQRLLLFIIKLVLISIWMFYAEIFLLFCGRFFSFILLHNIFSTGVIDILEVDFSATYSFIIFVLVIVNTLLVAAFIICLSFYINAHILYVGNFWYTYQHFSHFYHI